MNISDHFTLSELTSTDTGLPNVPQEAELNNLHILAFVLEKVRVVCGNKSVQIKSGYRSSAVNAKVGGVATSAHLRGLAADLVVPGQLLEETFDRIQRSGIDYDQLILEPGWVHIGLCEGAPRRENLKFNGSTYEKV